MALGLKKAMVLRIDDPQNLGRVQVDVPGGAPAWAKPCAPCGGPGRGFWFPPRAGDQVWIGFENDDIAKPVWMGFDWLPGELTFAGDDQTRGFLRYDGCEITMKADDLSLGAENLKLDASDDVKITATDSVDIDAVDSISIAASMDVKLESFAKVILDGATGVETVGWPMKFSQKSARITNIADLETRIAALEAALEWVGNGS